MEEIITTDLGAGSYPEPPESKEKCYIFNCDISCKAKVIVWAESEEEARNHVNANNYDEIEYYDYGIEQVNDCEIEE